MVWMNDRLMDGWMDERLPLDELHCIVMCVLLLVLPVLGEGCCVLLSDMDWLADGRTCSQEGFHTPLLIDMVRRDIPGTRRFLPDT
mmetsp:Transcript_29564/g.85562  ORF Transcript_29564/g.85562 Transcript_29564/m.85562 type:complete len:86 (+) Transcript_29564:345-602(+)